MLKLERQVACFGIHRGGTGDQPLTVEDLAQPQDGLADPVMLASLPQPGHGRFIMGPRLSVLPPLPMHMAHRGVDLRLEGRNALEARRPQRPGQVPVRLANPPHASKCHAERVIEPQL